MARRLAFVLLLSTVLCGLGAKTIPAINASEAQVVDFPALPPSIHELMASVDLVLFGRTIQSSVPDVVIDEHKRKWVRHYQRIEVTEVLKAEARRAPSKHVVLRQGVGTVDVHGKDIPHHSGEKILAPGDIVILFLRPIPTEPPNTYYPAYGPSSVLVANSDGTVTLPAGMRTMPEMLNRRSISLDELLVLLRGAGE